MTSILTTPGRIDRPGRHVVGSPLEVWLVRRLDPSAFAQTMAILLLGLLIWPAQFGGLFSITIVAGTSMEPALNLGDAVVTWKEPVSLGDVVLFRVPDGEFGAGNPVLHRVVDRDSEGWVTQGDNTSTPDQWRPTNADMVGVAKFRIPWAGRAIAILRSWWFIAGLAGLAVGFLFWPEARGAGQAPSRPGRHLQPRSRTSALSPARSGETGGRGC